MRAERTDGQPSVARNRGRTAGVLFRMPYRTSGLRMCVRHRFVVAAGQCGVCGDGVCESCAEYVTTSRSCDVCARRLRRRARRRLMLGATAGMCVVAGLLAVVMLSMRPRRYCIGSAEPQCFSGSDAAEDFYRYIAVRQAHDRELSLQQHAGHGIHVDQKREAPAHEETPTPEMSDRPLCCSFGGCASRTAAVASTNRANWRDAIAPIPLSR
jgi:hypothetical protein